MHLRPTLASVPIVLLLWLAIAGYLMQKHRSDLDAAAQESRNLTHAFEENIRRTVEAIDTTVRALRIARAHDPAHFDLVAWERDSGLTRDLTLQISIADRTGTIIATNLAPATKGVSIADRDHFRLVRDEAKDELFISRPVIGRVSRQWSVQFVRKLYDASGAFDGVVVVSLGPAFLSRFYASLDTGNGALLLAGRDGYLRAAAPETAAKLDTDLRSTPLMTGAMPEPFGTVDMTGTLDHVSRTYSWRRVDPYGLVVAIGISRTDALAEFRSTLHGCTAIGLGLTVIALLVGVVLDHNSRELRRSREILRAAVDNISQGLMVIDPERQVTVLNARAAELLDLPEELRRPGFAFDDLLTWQVESGEFDGPDLERIRAFVMSGGIEYGESAYTRTRHDGTVLEIRSKVLETGLAVRTFTDITEQQRTAQVLADARDAAEAAAKARSEFLAVMSHEIRTPLNGVIGIAGLLKDMELGPAQREYVRLIAQSGDHLLELVNDILDFSRLEADRVQLEETDFDPMALAQGVIGMFLAQANIKGLHLSAVAADEMPGGVTGDPGRLRQVLLNLISNAVKFTDKGWVSLTVAHESAAGGHVKLLFSVGDSGIGIAADAIERMFEEFTQADGSISRRFGGSGLGLAICRRLVELMGGHIGVESQPGVGSTFRFDVTLKRAASRPAVAPPVLEAPAGAGLHILLAEDNPTNRLVALRLIERLGHSADAVGTGAEAIAALDTARYDLILMDVMMPEMDGLTATRHIRASGRPEARIVIIGLTAGSGAENLAACLDAGMDAVTTKPVTLPRLRAAIAEGRAPPERHPPPVAEPEHSRSRLGDLAEMLGEDAVAEIVDAFTEDTRAHLAAMQQAAECGDSNTIYRRAHSVAGAARNVGADALAARASTMEETVGSMSAERIAAELTAMQSELETTLAGFGVKRVSAAAAP